MGGTQSKYVEITKPTDGESPTRQLVWEPENCPYGLYISIAACATSACTFLAVVVFFVVWYVTHNT